MKALGPLDSDCDDIGGASARPDFMAERVGFEPTVLVKVHTLSKRAP